MPMVMMESYEEFSVRHGGNPVEIGGRIYFPDGALTDSMGGMRVEPPCDPVAALRVRKWYVEERLRRAEAEFNQTRSQLSEQAALAKRYANLPSPSSAAPQMLLTLKGKVEEWRTELQAINTQLAATPDQQRRRQQEQAEQTRQQQAAALLAAINSIEL